MGHDVPTFIGADKSALTHKIRLVQPEYMPMGTNGMAEMAEMAMPIPDNTVPMMAGWGPHGPLEMGGMFSVVKVSRGNFRRRLQRSRLVREPSGHRGLGMDRRPTGTRKGRKS